MVKKSTRPPVYSLVTNPLLKKLIPLFIANNLEAHLIGPVVYDTIYKNTLVTSNVLSVLTDANEDQLVELLKETPFIVEEQNADYISISDATDSVPTKVEFLLNVKELQEYLCSLDFTFETLLLDLRANELVDKIHAATDLQKGIIRTVTNAEKMVGNDPTVAFKAIQTAAQRCWTPVSDLSDAIRRHTAEISSRDANEVEEFFKTLPHSKKSLHKLQMTIRSLELESFFLTFTEKHSTYKEFLSI